MPRNPPWSRDELILALDLYLREGLLDDRHTHVIELSQTLNQLSANSEHPDAERFRNPNGVAMKLANFASLDPHYGGVALSRGSRGDLEVWREFLTDKDRLKREAERIRLQAATTAESRSQNQRSSRYWAFNSNPRVYNIEQAVRILEVDSWTTKGKPIHIGDKVIIWKSQGGPHGRRGIVALGEVITEPEMRVDSDNPFWADPTQGSTPEPRVEVRYVVPPRLPLWYGDADVPVLSELTVNGGQGTVFNVTVAQWDAVVEAAGGWPQEQLGPVEPEVEEVQQIIAGRSRRRQGQGFAADAATRQAVEKRAMQLAIAHFEAEGWHVADVSLRASFDLLCTRPSGDELRVEVKGTTSEGSQVLLTANEVEHARTHFPNVALVVVSNIGLAQSIEDGLKATGGNLVILNPWSIDDGQLKPLSYSYRLQAQ